MNWVTILLIVALVTVFFLNKQMKKGTK